MLKDLRGLRIVGYMMFLGTLLLTLYIAILMPIESGIKAAVLMIFLLIAVPYSCINIRNSFPILKIIKPKNCLDETVLEIIPLVYLPESVYGKDAVLVNYRNMPNSPYSTKILSLEDFVEEDRQIITENLDKDTLELRAIAKIYIQKQATRQGPFMEIIADQEKASEIFSQQP